MDQPRTKLDDSLGEIVLYALRYCMGRRSYAPWQVTDWIKKHWDGLHKGEQENIRRDVREFVESGRDMGHDCDIKTWTDFKAWLDSQLN